VISEEALDQSRTLHDFITPITIACGRTQLLERHIQRTESLSSPERDLLLDDVKAVLDALLLLGTRVQARVAQGERPSD
jgi:hypothetical protein